MAGRVHKGHQGRTGATKSCGRVPSQRFFRYKRAGPARQWHQKLLSGRTSCTMRLVTLAAALLALVGAAVSAGLGRAENRWLPGDDEYDFRVLRTAKRPAPKELIDGPLTPVRRDAKRPAPKELIDGPLTPVRRDTKRPAPKRPAPKRPAPKRPAPKLIDYPPAVPVQRSGTVLSCGATTLARDTYILKSTNYPNNYGNNQDCTYSLTTANAGDTITLTCQAFNVEQHSSCSWDWLKVQGTKYCGANGPSGVTSLSTMTIEWHSDYVVTASGYSCTVIAAPPTSATCGRVNRASRIVGGQQTQVNEYPWQVALFITTDQGTSLCGGSVINKNYVLTAAHCTAGRTAGNISVRLRDHNIVVSDGEVIKTVKTINDHPQYTSAAGSGFDFSLLELTEPISFPSDNKIAPVCLPSSGSATYEGVSAIVSGWGSATVGGSVSYVLQDVTVPVISNSVCSPMYGGIINQSMLCAGDLQTGGVGSCTGDSGGALVTSNGGRYTQIGVVSFGRNPCGDKNAPGVYGRVTEVLPWISQTAGQYYT